MRISDWVRTSILAGLCVASASAQEYRLGQAVQPLRQNVFLRVDPAQDQFSGKTEIEVDLKKAGSPFRFHCADIQIDKAELVQGSQRKTLKVQAGKNDIFTATSSVPLAPGRYRLMLDFQGPFNRRSAGLYKYLDQGRPFLSSQFEMADARRCFPCFDEPCFKIPYQLTVAAPASQRVYNNSLEVSKKNDGNWVVHTFAPTLPIPSYLVALAVGPFDSVPVKGMSVPGSIVAPQGKLALARFSQTETPAILRTLEDYFGTKVAYSKVDQLAITEFPFGAMENPGMITYREDTILLNEKTALLPNRVEVLQTIAHELAHQWFGNLVTMKWWDDLWLNEAFATWMADKVVIKLHPELQVVMHTWQNDVMAMDANLTTRPIRKQVKSDADIMDGLGLAYAKGCAVLNMVERWLGEKNFQKGMRIYMKRHRLHNAVADDLWGALAEASGQNVKAVLNSFTSQSGFPLLTVEVKGKQVSLSQQRYLAYGVKGPERKWAFPVVLRYGAGNRQAVARLFLDSATQNAPLAFEPEWIFPDDGGVAYYRWELSAPMLKSLLAHRKSLSDREKLATLHNLLGLVSAGRLEMGDQLRIACDFLEERHPAVVDQAVQVLAADRTLFVNDSNRGAWSAFVTPRLKALGDRIGWTPRPGEPAKTDSLRTDLTMLYSLDASDPGLMARARQQVDNYLNGSGEVEPSTIVSYLRLCAQEGDEALLQRVKKAMEVSADPQRRTYLLGILGYFGVPAVQDRALDLMLDPAVTPSDLRMLITFNGYQESRRMRLQNWILKNYSGLRAKIPNAFAEEIVTCLSSCHDRESLEKIKSFFATTPKDDVAVQRAVDKMAESAENTIRNRERGQASFDAVLGSGK
ncbi:M1 family metallopeptidase [bacterium]|nr:M1 family metallopeptidase [bacterium]